MPLELREVGRALRALAGCAGIVTASACGEAEAPEGMGLLEPYLTQGQAGPWLGMYTDKVYRIRNATEASSGRYMYLPRDRRSEHYGLAVDIKIEGAEQGSGAGFILGYNPQPLSYLEVLLRADGALAVNRQTDAAREPVLTSSVSLASGFNRLAIMGVGPEVAILVNGDQVAKLTDQRAATNPGGILVYGIGSFTFARLASEGYVQEPARFDEPEAAADGEAASATEERERSPQSVQMGSTPDAPPEELQRRALEQMRQQQALPPGSQPQGETGDMLRLKRFDLIDQSGFAQPVVAISFLAPADWRFEGGVRWNEQWRCLSDLVWATARMTSADGSYGFEIFPPYVAEWSEDPMTVQMGLEAAAMGQRQCPMQQPFGAGDFVTGILVPQLRAQAQVLKREADPATAAAARRAIAGELASLVQAQGGSLETDAARVHLGYGASEEWIVATTHLMRLPGYSSSAAAQGNLAIVNSYTSAAERVFGFRAPRGHLDQSAALFAVMLASVRVNPVWDKAVADTKLALGRAMTAGAAERAGIWAKAMEAISQDIVVGWQKRQESLDRVATSFSQRIRETATYEDPDIGMRVELSDGYQSVWRNGTEEFVLSTDPGFNPNVVLGRGDWQRLQRVTN